MSSVPPVAPMRPCFPRPATMPGSGRRALVASRSDLRLRVLSSLFYKVRKEQAWRWATGLLLALCVW